MSRNRNTFSSYGNRCTASLNFGYSNEWESFAPAGFSSDLPVFRFIPFAATSSRSYLHLSRLSVHCSMRNYWPLPCFQTFCLNHIYFERCAMGKASVSQVSAKSAAVCILMREKLFQKASLSS